MSSIRITAIPPANTMPVPETLRKEFVDMIFPLAERGEGMPAQVQQSMQEEEGYTVDTGIALSLLDEKRPGAKEWFIESSGEKLGEKIVFTRSVCEVVH